MTTESEVKKRMRNTNPLAFISQTSYVYALNNYPEKIVILNKPEFMKTSFFSFLLMIACVFASAQKIKPPKKLEEFKKYIGLNSTNAENLLDKGGFSEDEDYAVGNFKEIEYQNDDYDDILILTIGNKVEGAGSGTIEEDEYNAFLTELKSKGYKLTKEGLHLSENNDAWKTDIWMSRDGKWKIYASRLKSEMFRILVATNKINYGELEEE